MKERFETFTVLVNRISRNIRKIKNQEMAEYGLRSAHISCLYYLYIDKCLTAKELCERCEEDKATISRAIEVLEEKGYIICKSNSAKRYRSPITLTVHGKAVAKTIMNKISFVLNEVCIELSEDERVEFYRSLSIISENLEQCVNGLEKLSKNK